MKKIQLAYQYVELMHIISYGVEMNKENRSHPNFIEHLRITSRRHTVIELENLITDCRRRLATKNN